MTTVYVRRGPPEEPTYTCQRVMLRGVVEDKCGRCGIGNVQPVIGSSCEMCRAVVVEVRDSKGPRQEG